MSFYTNLIIFFLSVLNFYQVTNSENVVYLFFFLIIYSEIKGSFSQWLTIVIFNGVKKTMTVLHSESSCVYSPPNPLSLQWPHPHCNVPACVKDIPTGRAITDTISQHFNNFESGQCPAL